MMSLRLMMISRVKKSVAIVRSVSSVVVRRLKWLRMMRNVVVYAAIFA